MKPQLAPQSPRRDLASLSEVPLDAQHAALLERV